MFQAPERGRWLKARNLREGDVVLLRRGEEAVIEPLASRAARLSVYNLAVEEPHTYAVGAAMALVHNKAMPVGGIYEFQGKSGKTYVGQPGNVSRRLGQHTRNGKLQPGNNGKVKVTTISGGKTAREIAEQRRIDELGGIGNLENKRNPIGPKRQHLKGGRN